ncbi:MAG: DUF2079 domain-containing protein [Acutalibacteraceae bacterium]
MKKITNKLSFNFLNIVTAIGGSWLLASTCLLLFFPQSGISLSFSDGISLLLFALFVLCISVPVIFLDAYFEKADVSRYFLVGTLLIFSFVLSAKRGDMNTYIFLFVVLLLALYCFDKKVSPPIAHFDIKKQKTIIIAAAVVTVLVTATVCSISVLRYVTYSAPNYDFGIFCNMFYNMKKSGLPISSCERDTVLSHFAVHISPIYYLLLPIYCVFSSPITLAVLQPIIVFSGVIPLYLLAKQLKLSNNTNMFMCIVFALFTPLSSGCFYDLHENCFLVPLLLWLFYFFEKDKKIPMFIFMLLVLLVKEDAFIYIAFFSLYVIIGRKKYLSGSLMLVISGAYFLFACFMLSKYGTGVMSSRYANLSESDGLIGAAKTILLNPGYAVSQVLETKTDSPDKFYYLAKIFCPLMFLPFCCKDFPRFILILPIFINLLTTYSYQYDISFQYTFGICAFLLYLSLLNLADMPEKKQQKMSFAAIIMSFMLFATIVIPKCDAYIMKYIDNKDNYEKITEAIEIIPDDAEVTASTYILPHLAQRDIIYEDEYHKTPTTQYFVLDLRYKAAEGRGEVYEEAGYKLIYEVEDLIEIYQKQ